MQLLPHSLQRRREGGPGQSPGIRRVLRGFPSVRVAHRRWYRRKHWRADCEAGRICQWDTRFCVLGLTRRTVAFFLSCRGRVSGIRVIGVPVRPGVHERGRHHGGLSRDNFSFILYPGSIRNVTMSTRLSSCCQNNLLLCIMAGQEACTEATRESGRALLSSTHRPPPRQYTILTIQRVQGDRSEVLLRRG